MKTLQFQTRVNPDQTLCVPPEIAAQVPSDLQIRVVLLVPEGEEEQAWTSLTTEQFLKGYADSDAIYDQLPAR